LLRDAMLGVVTPGVLVGDGVEHNHREALPVGGREGLEVDEARHRSGSILHARGELVVAVGLGIVT
jgi:hypothetical protein